jgi:hypothetical protein
MVDVHKAWQEIVSRGSPNTKLIVDDETEGMSFIP